MNKPLTVLAAFAAVLLTSCKPEKPDEVLTAYLEEVNHGEFDEAAKYVDKKSLSGIAALNMTPVDEKLKMMQQSVDVEVTSQKVEDSIAYLKVQLTIDNRKMPEGNFALKKEEGEWKVVMSERFDKILQTHQQPGKDVQKDVAVQDTISAVTTAPDSLR